MSRSSRCVCRLLATLLVAGFSAAVVAEDLPAVESPAIPPGQEELLLDMLGKGATLPDGCVLTDGRIEYTVIEASYKCSSGDVILEIAHVSQVLKNDTETGQFTIAVLEGSPVQSLVDEVSARIVKREAEFEWVPPSSDSGADE